MQTFLIVVAVWYSAATIIVLNWEKEHMRTIFKVIHTPPFQKISWMVVLFVVFSFLPLIFTLAKATSKMDSMAERFQGVRRRDIVN